MITLGKLYTLALILGMLIIITLRIFGILGEPSPDSLIFISVPLVISLIIFLIQALDTKSQWYTGINSLLKFIFISPLFYSVILAYMLMRIGGTMLYIKNSIGADVFYNTGDLLTYVMVANLVTSLIYCCMLFFFNASEPLVKAVNITGFCSFLLILTAIVNIYFYVEITTKPVLP